MGDIFTQQTFLLFKPATVRSGLTVLMVCLLWNFKLSGHHPSRKILNMFLPVWKCRIHETEVFNVVSNMMYLTSL